MLLPTLLWKASGSDKPPGVACFLPLSLNVA